MNAGAYIVRGRLGLPRVRRGGRSDHDLRGVVALASRRAAVRLERRTLDAWDLLLELRAAPGPEREALAKEGGADRTRSGPALCLDARRFELRRRWRGLCRVCRWISRSGSTAAC